jgi:hypothetical protein
LCNCFAALGSVGEEFLVLACEVAGEEAVIMVFGFGWCSRLCVVTVWEFGGWYSRVGGDGVAGLEGGVVDCLLERFEFVVYAGDDIICVV